VTVALVSIEGVLGEDSVIHGFYPIVDGLRLFHAFRGGYQIMLSSVQADSDGVEHWLMVNGLVRQHHYDELRFKERRWNDFSDSQVRSAHLHESRALGADVGLFVTADPEAALDATEMGVISLFFAHPSYHWSTFRPDRTRLPREWQQLENEVTRQRELRATDPRLIQEST
jgi:hypothetical protein